jgi:hypothetical protein
MMPLVQPALAARVGQILVQAENFRKKFLSLPVPHLRVPFNHAAPLSSSHFGDFLVEKPVLTRCWMPVNSGQLARSTKV